MNLSDKERLLKLIGMLGSSFDGERANAANMIGRMAEARKLTINELIAEVYDTPAKPSQQKKPPDPEPKPDFSDVNKANDLLKMLRRIRDNPAVAARVLTDWEIQFASDVSDRYQSDYELSEKQLNVTERILNKARRVFP